MNKQPRFIFGSIVLALGLLVGACAGIEDEGSDPQPSDVSDLGEDMLIRHDLDPGSPACLTGGEGLVEAVRGDMNCGDCAVITCGNEIMAHMCLPRCSGTDITP